MPAHTPPIDRILARVKRIPNGCWLWPGVKSHFGHGVIKNRGKRVGTHRVTWEWKNGPIPEGLCVLHKCDVPACVNPKHLFLGTKTDNAKDRDRKGRQARGERSFLSRLTEKQVKEIRRKFSEGGVTKVQLAKEFGVTDPAIGAIVRRKVWKHV